MKTLGLVRVTGVGDSCGVLNYVMTKTKYKVPLCYRLPTLNVVVVHSLQTITELYS
jgi:hypothetical protein